MKLIPKYLTGYKIIKPLQRVENGIVYDERPRIKVSMLNSIPADEEFERKFIDPRTGKTYVTEGFSYPLDEITVLLDNRSAEKKIIDANGELPRANRYTYANPKESLQTGLNFFLQPTDVLVEKVVNPVLETGMNAAIHTFLPGHAGDKAMEFLGEYGKYASPSYYLGIKNPSLLLAVDVGTLSKVPKVIKAGKTRYLDSFNENIAPFGYTDMPELKISKWKLIGHFAKDFINPFKKFDFTKDSRWYRDMLKTLAENPELASKPMFGTTAKNVILFRDDALRLATKNPTRHGIYRDNGNGTYRYDVERIKEITDKDPETNAVRVYKKRDKGRYYGNDRIGSNGGMADYIMDDPNINLNEFAPYDYQRPGYTMVDVFDLLPLKDLYRSFLPKVTRFAKKHPKTFGWIRDIELLKPFGGGFKLEHHVPAGKTPIVLGTKQGLKLDNITTTNKNM